MGKINPPIERRSKDMSRPLRNEEIQTANNQRSTMGASAAIKCTRLTCVYGLARYLWCSVERKESGGNFKTADRVGSHYGELCDSVLVHILLENKRKVFKGDLAEKRACRIEHILMAPYQASRLVAWGQERWETLIHEAAWPLSHPAPPWDPKILVVVVIVCLFVLPLLVYFFSPFCSLNEIGSNF